MPSLLPSFSLLPAHSPLLPFSLLILPPFHPFSSSPHIFCSPSNYPRGAFVMEYCGEVISPVQFEERKKQYTNEKRRHYYFMSLRSDEVHYLKQGLSYCVCMVNNLAL